VRTIITGSSSSMCSTSTVRIDCRDQH